MGYREAFFRGHSEARAGFLMSGMWAKAVCACKWLYVDDLLGSDRQQPISTLQKP